MLLLTAVGNDVGVSVGVWVGQGVFVFTALALAKGTCTAAFTAVGQGV